MSKLENPLPKKIAGCVVHPLTVLIPPQLASFFDGRGYEPEASTEDRLARRLRVRQEIAIEFFNTPMALLEATTERPRCGTALIKDLSKEGLAFLFDHQIYPTETLRVYVQGRVLQTQAMRCVRVGYQCYEIGVRVDGVTQQ